MAEKKRLTRREREHQARRQEILQAARRVFAEKGFHGATVDEIAEAAEFGKGTLYSFFENKDDLFFSLLKEGLDTLYKLAAESITAHEDCRQQIADMTDGILRYFEENIDFFRILATERENLCGRLCDEWRERLLEKHRELVGLVAQVIESGMERGSVRRVDPVRIAQAFHSLIHSFAFYRFRAKERRSLEDEKNTIVNVLFDGIGQR